MTSQTNELSSIGNPTNIKNIWPLDNWHASLETHLTSLKILQTYHHGIFTLFFYQRRIISGRVQAWFNGPKQCSNISKPFFFQTPRNSRKCCSNWNIFMMTSIVLLSTRMQNIKMRSSKLFIKGHTPNQISRSGFGCTFHELNYFELDFFSISLEFVIHLRSSSNNNWVKNHQTNVVLSH